jgi:hypothetical protein
VLLEEAEETYQTSFTFSVAENFLQLKAGFPPRSIVATQLAFEPSTLSDLDVSASLRESFMFERETTVVVATIIIEIELVFRPLVFIAYH